MADETRQATATLSRAVTGAAFELTLACAVVSPEGDMESGIEGALGGAATLCATTAIAACPKVFTGLVSKISANRHSRERHRT